MCPAAKQSDRSTAVHNSEAEKLAIDCTSQRTTCIEESKLRNKQASRRRNNMVPRVDGSTTRMKSIYLKPMHNMYAPQCMHDTYTMHVHAICMLSYYRFVIVNIMIICMKSLCSEEPAMKSMHALLLV